MTEILPVALQNRSLLQALYDGEHKTLVALAAGIGRDKSNVSKSLKALESAGLAWRPEDAFWSLTVPGIDTLSRLERLDEQVAQGDIAAPSEGATGLLHAQLFPSLRNARRDWDSAEATLALFELAESIASAAPGGLILQNLVVRPEPVGDDYVRVEINGQVVPTYEILAGERRWRAVRQLIKDGRWDPAKPLPVQIVTVSDAEFEKLSLIENLQRRDLKPLEEARKFKQLVDRGMSTAELAEAIGRTQRMVQQRLQLLELDERDQERLDKGELTIEAARASLANRPQPIAITPEQTLVFLELAWAVAKAGEFWANIPTDYRTLRRLKDEGDLVWLDRFVHASEDWQTGQCRIRLAYNAHQLLAQLTGSEEAKAKTLTEPLRKARWAEAPLFDPRANALSANYSPTAAEELLQRLEREGKYMTDFLNPPFMVDPAKLKELEEKAEARRREQEEWRRQRAEEEKHEAARKAAALEARQIVAQFEDKAQAGPQRIAKVLDVYGRPLPWKWTPATDDDAGFLTDANGEEFSLASYDNDEALLGLVMAAVNAAGGHAPVIAEPPADRPDDAEDSPTREAADRPEFVTWVADRIQQLLPHWKSERCRSRAGHALDEFLKLEGCEFGDEGLTTWMRSDAHDIADGYVADLDEGGSHLDDEDDAGAPDGDGEFEEA